MASSIGPELAHGEGCGGLLSALESGDDNTLGSPQGAGGRRRPARALMARRSLSRIARHVRFVCPVTSAFRDSP